MNHEAIRVSKCLPVRTLALFALAITLPLFAAGDSPFDFALIGDAPYAPTTGVLPNKRQAYPSPQYNNLIAAINGEQKVAFTIHAGDIKAGDTLCVDEVYTQNLALFNTFTKPVIYAPGDNEWTDCHRANNGSMNPIERLAFLRTTFYPNTMSLGQNKIALSRQSDDPAMAAFVPYCPNVDPTSSGCKFVENVMWTYGPEDSTYKILFVALNMPGSNNNRNRITGLFLDLTDAEYSARNAANIAWINKAFNQLYEDATIKGMVIVYQGNTFERFLEASAGFTITGFADFVATVRNRTKNQTKRVLLVHGDTHYLHTDKPLTSQYPECLTAVPACVNTTGVRLMNVDRLEVFGQTEVHWVRVKVEPKEDTLFVVEPQVVQANLLTVP